MATCWSCQKVKGRRACPARGGELICSKCCGTKRKVEIQCPDECVYLHGADPNWQSATQQKQDARFLSRFLSLNENQVVFLLFAHHLLLSASARFVSLSDMELQEVLATCLKTLETQAKGIVYSHKSSSPHLDAHAEWLANVIAARSRIATAPDVSDRDVRTVLEAIGHAIRDHASSSTTPRSYLETAEYVLRFSLGAAPEIEIPKDVGEVDPSPPSQPSKLIVPP